VKADLPRLNIGKHVVALLEIIQSDMFQKAKSGRDEKLVTVTEWKDFVPALNRNCLVLTPFCDEKEWEKEVKVGTK